MNKDLERLKKECVSKLNKVRDISALDAMEHTFFSRKSGEFTGIMKELKSMSEDEKKKFGRMLNEVKRELEELFEQKKNELQKKSFGDIADRESIDVTRPLLPQSEAGHLHPLTLVQRDLERLFASMGFMVLEGPELESDYYNFEALNIPKTHPARDMQDTFYIKDSPQQVMRTHTTSVQVRAMQKYGPPLRAIVPGKCYRNEATDPRHEHTFYQLDGVVIDRHITFAHMKGVFQAVADHLFGAGTKIRLMPKFYPFVEPGVRGEITCFICKGAGCRVCKNTGWLEAMPGGMIHPHVLRAGNIDPDIYRGFAFGFGLTRLVMLRYGIEDVRHLMSGDMQFLRQF